MEPILVDGDDLTALFALNPNVLALKTATPDSDIGWTPSKMMQSKLELGCSYIAKKIEYFLSVPASASGTDRSPVVLGHHHSYRRSADPRYFLQLSASNEKIEEFNSNGRKLPLLTWDGVAHPLWNNKEQIRTGVDSPKPLPPASIFVERLDDIDPLEKVSNSDSASREGFPRPADFTCHCHIQIGRADSRKVLPAVACDGLRCVITSLSNICEQWRIRKSLSYDSIAVDLLRLIRGRDAAPKLDKLFNVLAGPGARPAHDNAPLRICLIVRINYAALLLYYWNPISPESSGRECARLIYHRSLPAPVDYASFGKMDGFSGFLAAHLAASAYKELSKPDGRFLPSEFSHPGLSDHFTGSRGWLSDALKRGILWQVAHARRGLLHLFFQKIEDDWEPLLDQPESWTARNAHFRDLEMWLKTNAEGWKAPVEKLDRNVQEVAINIQAAVSRHIQWFLAGDQIASGRTAKEQAEEFGKVARELLAGSKDAGRRLPKDYVSVVSIERLQLMDRREVEDYLAIRDAFRNYGRSKLPRPLNIAVFGPPGAGKSYGVKQVAKHIANNDDKFSSEDSLTFNLSQFASLQDLVGALHLVRNKCVKGPIPVIFWDEFDSQFDNRPFGWLKYFLAPMQDGEFTDRGITYQLGRSVFVFAGGVNRTFEEINARLRNPSFVEAKGPDFISRLRAHLNIRGVNKPEDEADQSRYILRRAIVLYDMLAARLRLPNGQLPHCLLHKTVADAFLGVESFKHGARSMEAILDMCDLRQGATLCPADLPSKAQLDMQVDASAFMHFVHKDEEPDPVTASKIRPAG